MNSPAPIKPLRFIVEATPAQVAELVQPLLAWLTPRAPAQPPRPEDEDEEDDDAPLPRTADPPAVKNLTAAGSPVPAGYKLGKLCVRGHRWEGTRQSLRGQSSGKCVQCMREHRQRHKAPQPLAPVTPRAPVLAPRTDTGPARPPLPQHLALTCFLSPIRCAIPTHVWRDTAYTLRFVETEGCCQCVAGSATLEGPPLAMAGD